MRRIHVSQGVVSFWRWSIGWNFHRMREVHTFGLAVSFAPDRWMLLLGPVTFVWLFD